MSIGLVLLLLGSSGIAGVLPFAQVSFPGSIRDLRITNNDFIMETQGNNVIGKYELCSRSNTPLDWKVEWVVYQGADTSGDLVETSAGQNYKPIRARGCLQESINFGALGAGVYSFGMTFWSSDQGDEYETPRYTAMPVLGVEESGFKVGGQEKGSGGSSDDVKNSLAFHLWAEQRQRFSVELTDGICSGSVDQLNWGQKQGWQNSKVCEAKTNEKITLNAKSTTGTASPIWAFDGGCKDAIVVNQVFYGFQHGCGYMLVPSYGFEQNPITIEVIGDVGVEMREAAVLPNTCSVNLETVPNDARGGLTPSDEQVTVNRGDTLSIEAKKYYSVTSIGTFRFDKFIKGNGINTDQWDVDENKLEFYCPTKDEVNDNSRYRGSKSLVTITADFERAIASRIYTVIDYYVSISPSVEELDDMVFFDESEVSVAATILPGGEWRFWEITPVNTGNKRQDGNKEISFDVGGKFGSMSISAVAKDLTRTDKGRLTIEVKPGLDEFGFPNAGLGTYIECKVNDAVHIRGEGEKTVEEITFQTYGTGFNSYTHIFTNAADDEARCKVDHGDGGITKGGGHWLLNNEKHEETTISVPTEDDNVLLWIVNDYICVETDDNECKDGPGPGLDPCINNPALPQCHTPPPPPPPNGMKFTIAKMSMTALGAIILMAGVFDLPRRFVRGRR